MAVHNYADFECPYCGEEQGDSWEYAEEAPEKHDCDSCGKEFLCWIEKTVEYLTESITPESPEETKKCAK